MSARSFEGPDRPLLADLQNCIHCGFCLPVCPTYQVTGQELESPRGRLHLIRSVIDGRIEATDRVLGHLDLCLQCRACETACPSAVPYGRIMEDARASVLNWPAGRRPLAWTARTALVRRLVNGGRAPRLLFRLGRAYRRLGLQRAARGPLRRLVPSPLARAEAALPIVATRPFRARPVLAEPHGPVRGSVALLLGCIHGELTPNTHRATVRVLAHLGYRVVAPPEQACCGALSAHAGDREHARALARRNIAAFETAGVSAVIVNAAGCGAAMKEYGRLLQDDPAWSDRAVRFAISVRDVLEFVAGQDFAHDLGTPPDVDTLAIQDACHLAHAQRIREAPRVILGAIPGVSLRELATPDRCCGAAGSYALTQPAMSQAVLTAKLDDIRHTGATTIATANIGCTLQLERGCREVGLAVTPLHVIELLDAAYRAGGAYRTPTISD